MAMLWVLNLSDGGATLLDIAERSGLPFALIARAAHRLEETDLLRRAVTGQSRDLPAPAVRSARLSGGDAV